MNSLMPQVNLTERNFELSAAEYALDEAANLERKAFDAKQQRIARLIAQVTPIISVLQATAHNYARSSINYEELVPDLSGWFVGKKASEQRLQARNKLKSSANGLNVYGFYEGDKGSVVELGLDPYFGAATVRHNGDTTLAANPDGPLSLRSGSGLLDVQSLDDDQHDELLRYVNRISDNTEWINAKRSYILLDFIVHGQDHPSLLSDCSKRNQDDHDTWTHHIDTYNSSLEQAKLDARVGINS